MNGLLVLDKPAGMTSHDVVAIVRRATGEKSIGHLGTLDPMATGVLPLLLGKYTRLAQFFNQANKRYTGHIRFGFATDTFDAEGTPSTDPQTPHPLPRPTSHPQPKISRRHRPAPPHLLRQKDQRRPRPQTGPCRSRSPRQTRPHHHPRLRAHLPQPRHRRLHYLRLRRRIRPLRRARNRPASRLRSPPLLPPPNQRRLLLPRPRPHHRRAKVLHPRRTRAPSPSSPHPPTRDAPRHCRRPACRAPPQRHAGQSPRLLRTPPSSRSSPLPPSSSPSAAASPEPCFSPSSFSASVPRPENQKIPLPISDQFRPIQLTTNLVRNTLEED